MSEDVLEDHLRAGRLQPAEAMARHRVDADRDDVGAKVALARIAFLRGATDDGIVQLERVLQKSPREAEALAHLAVMLDKKGDRTRALALAQRAVALGARVPVCDVLLADDARERGAHDEAQRFYERALQSDPKLALAWFGRGKVMHQQGELADAEDALARAVELAPLLLDAWVQLVTVEREGGALDAATDNLALALQSHPGHPTLLALKAFDDKRKADSQDGIDRGLIDVRRLICEGNLDEALRLLDTLVDKAPGDPRFLVVDAEVAAITGQGDIPTLIHALQRQVRDRPTSWEPRAALGRLLLRAGTMQNLRQGLAHCEEAWRTSGEHPRATLFLFEAYIAHGKNRYARALAERLAQLDVPESGLVKSLLASMG